VLWLAIAGTLLSRLGWRMLRFVTLIPVVLVVAFVLRFGGKSMDQTLSARSLAANLADVETHQLPVAVCGASRELEYGLAFYRNQRIARYEQGDVPAGEHLVVAPPAWKQNVIDQSAGRHVTYLGHYGPQNVDYYFVARAADTN